MKRTGARCEVDGPNSLCNKVNGRTSRKSSQDADKQRLVVILINQSKTFLFGYHYHCGKAKQFWQQRLCLANAD